MSISYRAQLNNGINFQLPVWNQPCLLCGTSTRHGVCCSACDADLLRLPDTCCPVCALPTPLGEVCGHCLKHPRHFSHTTARFVYTFPLDRLIQALKFDAQLQLANFLADALCTRIATRPDAIVPMPLHPTRLRERGFNQSLELARRLGRRLNIPLWAEAASRIRDTPAQASLTWKIRQKNLRAAFACVPQVAGKRIALVDDVMTTGASLNELALALTQAGAAEVEAWVVARTLPHSR